MRGLPHEIPPWQQHRTVTPLRWLLVTDTHGVVQTMQTGAHQPTRADDAEAEAHVGLR
jgi:hypothetical protein